MNLKLVTYVSLVAAALEANAQSAPRRPPEDQIPIFLMSQAMADEHRVACIARFPELADKVNAEYQSWDLAKAQIEITVNGRKYTSPLATAARLMIRAEIGRKDDQRMKSDCSNFMSILRMAGEGLSSESLLSNTK